jgi:hypothetical protein
MLLAYQGQPLERIMRFVLSLAVTVLGAIRANSEEIALGVSLASADNRVTVGSSRNDCPEGGWNTATIKEGESESPEMTAVIENNREDRERTVVIDH